jgi:hypothetical protein
LRRDDLTPVELRNYLVRNISRIHISFVQRHPHLRVRLLALIRKNPDKTVRDLTLPVARKELAIRLPQATLEDVDALFDDFLNPSSPPPEFVSLQKPRFQSHARKPEFRAKIYPSRDSRPRTTRGRIEKRPFSPFEVDRLYFFYEVRSIFHYSF